MNIIDELTTYLLSDIAVDQDLKTVSPEDDLLSQGIIDSMGIMKLVAFIEKRFNFQLTEDDLVPENFQTLNAIASFIESRI